MLVQQILKGKGVGGVVTMSPNVTVGEAARELTSRKIGAVVVSSDGRVPLGILSERDIVRGLSASGANCLADRVDGLMTRKLVTCTPNESSDEVLAKMTSGRFRHMPVMDGEEMVGLISIGDVVKARLSELAMEKDALEGMIKGF